MTSTGYRFNSADEDKRLAVEDVEGLLYWRMLSETMPLETLIDQVDSNTSYIGKAAVGTLITSPGWQICKVVTTAEGSLSKKYADSVTSFTKVWSDRAGYGY